MKINTLAEPPYKSCQFLFDIEFFARSVTILFVQEGLMKCINEPEIPINLPILICIFLLIFFLSICTINYFQK